MRGSFTRALPFLVPLVVATSALPARAADPLVEARADYDAAAAAYDRADYKTAALLFARADDRAPNPRALQLAMAAALLASDAGLGMNLVDRSEDRARSAAHDPAIAELARKLRVRFERAAGRVRISCAPAAPCRPSVDGDAIDATRMRWVAPGRHVVTFETGAAPSTREVTVRAGEIVDVAPETVVAPPKHEEPTPTPTPTPTPAPVEPERTGLPSPYFWTGVAVTGAAIGVSTILTVIVANRHDDFVNRPSATTAEAGDAAQTRARVAWAVTGAFALTTVVLGVMTDFGGASRRTGAALSLGPMAASVTGTFW
jgi:hypothetical protein